MSWSDGLEVWMRPAADYLVAVAQRYDPNARVTSVRRSSAEQARLYRRYLAGQSQYPAAPPGQSYHEYGRAFDLYSTNDALLRALGGLWASMGGTWHESDNIHFQA